MLNLTQLALIVVLDFQQSVHVFGIVLAQQGVDVVQAFVDACQFGRVVIERVHNVADAVGNVLEVDYGAAHPGSKTIHLGQAALGVFQPLGNGAEAVQNAVFLTVELTLDVPQRFFQLGNVAQLLLHRFKLLVLIGLQLQCGQLVQLETDVVLVAAHLVDGAAGIFQFA